MRKYLNAEIMQQSMKLKQMGADVTVINSNFVMWHLIYRVLKFRMFIM